MTKKNQAHIIYPDHSKFYNDESFLIVGLMKRRIFLRTQSVDS